MPAGRLLPACDTGRGGTDRERSVGGKNLPEEAQSQLHSFAKDTLLAEMLGGTLQKSTETLSRERGAYLLTGLYSCREVISHTQWEQIGDMHG